MIAKTFLIAGLLLNAHPSFSFSCYFTLVKDSCWTNFDVTVDVTDTSTNKSVVKVTAPRGKSWERVPFTCDAGQRLIYSATYEPVFWRSEVGKTYQALRYWTLPAQLDPKQSAWVISVCYPKEFSTVPLPPTADSNCHCDFKSIPPIKVQ